VTPSPAPKNGAYFQSWVMPSPAPKNTHKNLGATIFCLPIAHCMLGGGAAQKSKENKRGGRF